MEISTRLAPRLAALAITEAIIGQLYLVVLVAGVVGILLSQRKT